MSSNFLLRQPRLMSYANRNWTIGLASMRLAQLCQVCIESVPSTTSWDLGLHRSLPHSRVSHVIAYGVVVVVYVLRCLDVLPLIAVSYVVEEVFD